MLVHAALIHGIEWADLSENLSKVCDAFAPGSIRKIAFGFSRKFWQPVYEPNFAEFLAKSLRVDPAEIEIEQIFGNSVSISMMTMLAGNGNVNFTADQEADLQEAMIHTQVMSEQIVQIKDRLKQLEAQKTNAVYVQAGHVEIVDDPKTVLS